MQPERYEAAVRDSLREWHELSIQEAAAKEEQKRSKAAKAEKAKLKAEKAERDRQKDKELRTGKKDIDMAAALAADLERMKKPKKKKTKKQKD